MTVAIGRLSAGWRPGTRAATLREHAAVYGQVPASTWQQGDHLISQVTAAGLTGRGGGAFPTGTKMQAVAAGRHPAVVVANGMESEPASRKDQLLLARAPHLVLDGIALAAWAVGATQAHLCLPASRDRLVDHVLTAVGERQQAGLDAVAVSVYVVPSAYVASEESSLVRWLNGGGARPTTVPPRPSQRGVARRATLVDNVETLAHVALIARHGAAWFRQAGRRGAAGTMLTTVTGAVARPGVYEVEAGATIAEVLSLAGLQGGVQAVLAGGYGGSWHELPAVADLPFTTDGLLQAGGSPGPGILVALPDGNCGLAEAARILRYLASQSAQQCGPCMFGLPAIADDLSRLAAGWPDRDVLARLDRRFGQITGRGACRHPDGAIKMAASALTVFAADAHAHARRRPCLAGRQRGGRR